MPVISATKQSGHFVHPRPPNGFVWVEGVAPLSNLSSSSSSPLPTTPTTHITGKFLPPLVRVQPVEGTSSSGGMLSGSGAPSGLVSGLGDGFGYEASFQPFSPHARLVLHLTDAVTFACYGASSAAATIGKGGSVPPGTILWEEAPVCVFPDTFDALRSLIQKDSTPTPKTTPTTSTAEPFTPLDGQKAFLQRLAAVWKLGTEGNNKSGCGDAAQQAAIKALLGSHASRGYSALSYALAGYASQRGDTTASSPSPTKSEVEDVEIDTFNLFNGLPLLLGCSPNPTPTSLSPSGTSSLLHATFSHYFARSGYSASRPSPGTSTVSGRDPIAALVGLGSMSAKCLDVLNNNGGAAEDTTTPSLAALWCPILMYLAQHRSLSLFSFQLAPTLTDADGSNSTPSSSSVPSGGGGGAGKASEILRRKLLERDTMNGMGGGVGDRKGDVSKRISAFFPLSSMAAYVRMSSTANVAAHLHWITSEEEGTANRVDGGGAKYRVVLRAVASKTINHGETIKLPASLLASSCMTPPPPPPTSSKGGGVGGSGGEVPLLTPTAIGAGLCSGGHLESIKGLYSTLAKSLAQLGGEGSLTAAALAAYILPAPPTFLPHHSLVRPLPLLRTPCPYRMYPTRLPNTLDPFSSSLDERRRNDDNVDDKSTAAAYNLATSRISKDTMDGNATMATARVYQVAEGIVMMLSQGNFFNTLYGDQMAARKASSLLSLVSKHVEQQQRASGGGTMMAPIAASPPLQQP